MKNVKKVIVAVMALTLVFAMTACKDKEQKEPLTADVVAAVKSQIEFPEMSELTKGDIVSYYDIDVNKIVDMAYIIAGSGITADEVLVVKMDSKESAEKMKTLMEARRESVKSTAADYTPDELEKLTSAVIEVKGTYAVYAATGNNSKAKEIIDNAF